MFGKVNGKYIGDLQCWPFSETQRLNGILLLGFEQSEFYPNATDVAQVERAKARIWFEDEAVSNPQRALQGPPDGLTHAFLVQAEGRLSLCDAWFGHQGQYPREFIASRIITAQPVSTP